jgi:chromosome partitioning protein
VLTIPPDLMEILAGQVQLIPLRPSVLDIYAVESTAAVVKATNARVLLVLNACVPPTSSGESATTAEARAALAGMGLRVASASLTQRIDYTRALNGGEAVSEFAPESKATAEVRRLWSEVQKEMS